MALGFPDFFTRDGLAWLLFAGLPMDFTCCSLKRMDCKVEWLIHG